MSDDVFSIGKWRGRGCSTVAVAVTLPRQLDCEGEGEGGSLDIFQNSTIITVSSASAINNIAIATASSVILS